MKGGARMRTWSEAERLRAYSKGKGARGVR
jgi:hypothetical protein